MNSSAQSSTSSKQSSEKLPRNFGRYVLFDLIGKGGMAEIYLARARTSDATTSRLVVLKQILPELSADQKFADALVQEAKLAARLSHTNVVQVYDLGRSPENARLFIAMEYVEGLDLNELLRRCARSKTPLPVEFSLLIVMETLRGLDYAHRRTDDNGRPLGIVHRDVSPSNVLVSVDGEAKLCDFGIARANDSADALSADAIQGKAGYMSPEHARGHELDARADVFAAGVILWELLAGRRMYRVDANRPEISLLDVAKKAEIPTLPERSLPHESELHDVVHKALALDREVRFASAAAMLEALQRYVAKARLVASPIRFGEWLTEHFGVELIEARRARERAVRALEMGPIATVTPLAPKTDADASREIRPADRPSIPVDATIPDTDGLHAARLEEVLKEEREKEVENSKLQEKNSPVNRENKSNLVTSGQKDEPKNTSSSSGSLNLLLFVVVLALIAASLVMWLK